ncbi:MAG: DUF3263 domain-containing protein [Propionibacteriales bacterium]|nr:DUF3263 domain-containing protein [Propionibacteriales bacterium]
MTDDDRTIIRAMTLSRRGRTGVAADLGISVPALHQRALHLLTDPDAEREMPAEIHRLRRIRDLQASRRQI